MPKVILDTNVIISGIVFGRDAGKVLDLVFEGEFELILCEELKNEVLRILVNKFNFSFDDLKVVNELLEVGENFKIQKPYPKVSRDKNDNFLLSLIQNSKADLLITGDKDLLILEEFQNCRILKLNDFLNSFLPLD